MKTTEIIRQAPPEKPRCQQACPAGTDIPRFVHWISQGKFNEALAVIRERNPFPSVTGHACLRFCEADCRRSEVDAAMGINALERFATEHGSMAKESAAAKTSGKSVAIIGSGPAGLTAAYYLARLGGHSVTVFETLPEPGGMMRYGIPDYRLPKEALANDIDVIKSSGINIKTNTRVESLEKLQEEGFDAVLLAVGAHQGQKLPVPGADLEGVLIGTSFLKDICLGKDVKVGKQVVVLGGGNVAIDSARTALRLGAEKVSILYRRAKDKMPASPDDIEEGEEEGIIIHPLQAFTRIMSNNGHVCGVEARDVSSIKVDENREVHIESIPGSEHTVPADTVIFAIGQLPELELIKEESRIKTTRRGTLEVDPVMATDKAGVFAAGDAVTGAASVIEAVATGRKAAIYIDKYLGGDGVINETLASPEKKEIWLGFDESILDVDPSSMPLLPADKRTSNFDEVKLGFNKETALREAGRCLRCDQQVTVQIIPDKCTECYACQLICSMVYQQGNCNTDKARIQIGVPDFISYNEDCIGGCSLCVQHCLAEAITASA